VIILLPTDYSCCILLFEIRFLPLPNESVDYLLRGETFNNEAGSLPAPCAVLLSLSLIIDFNNN
jgi:hypothetical protein